MVDQLNISLPSQVLDIRTQLRTQYDLQGQRLDKIKTYIREGIKAEVHEKVKPSIHRFIEEKVAEKVKERVHTQVCFIGDPFTIDTEYMLTFYLLAPKTDSR